MKRTIFLASALTTVLVTASGCSSLHKALGLEKQPPDEYAVVESPPLTMPPDFGLRPPASGSSRPAESSVQDQAEQTVFTTGNAPAPDPGVVAGNDFTAGEAALLNGAGAAAADNSIRDQIDQENAAKAKKSDSLIHRILYHGLKKQTDDTLDAQQESERIQSDVASGKPVTSGTTPTIQRTNRTFFDSL